jgi:hypothetical protein
MFGIKTLCFITRWKGSEMLYNLCIQGSPRFPLEVGLNPKFV